MHETVEVFCINQHEQPFMSFSCESVDWVNKAGSSHKLKLPAGDGPWHEDVFAGRYRGIWTQSYWTTMRMCWHRQKQPVRKPSAEQIVDHGRSLISIIHYLRSKSSSRRRLSCTVRKRWPATWKGLTCQTMCLWEEMQYSPFFYLFMQEVCPRVTTLLVLEYRLGRCHGSLGHKYPWKCDYVQHMFLRVGCQAG